MAQILLCKKLTTSEVAVPNKDFVYPNLNRTVAKLVVRRIDKGYSFVFTPPRGSPANPTLNPNFSEHRIFTKHLIEHGHTKIAHIGGPLHWINNQLRYNGYLEAMRKAGLADTLAIHAESTTVETGTKALAELLDRPERPTAIFSANDAMVVGAARGALERGLTIPGDLALIGFDNILIAEHFSPPITTIKSKLDV